jgi:autophagy-related protein 18
MESDNENDNKAQKDSNNFLYLSFNQDNSCISIGTQDGYMIYNVSPFSKIYKRSNY